MAKVVRLPSRQRRHHWSDWVGFLFCVWLVITVFRRSPTLGMLMMPACLHDIVAGVAFLVRRPARAQLSGWGPRMATYTSTFLIPAFLALASSRYPSWIRFTPASWAVRVGYGVWMTGILAAVWTVWQLRYSFSLAPQARELVRRGPYRLARHPIYAAYLLQYLGILLGHLTLPFCIAVLAWLGLIGARIHYEEMVLESTFPQYAEYRQRVGMFGPRLRPSSMPEYAPPASSETFTKAALQSPLPEDGFAMGTTLAVQGTNWTRKSGPTHHN